MSTDSFFLLVNKLLLFHSRVEQKVKKLLLKKLGKTFRGRKKEKEEGRKIPGDEDVEI